MKQIPEYQTKFPEVDNHDGEAEPKSNRVGNAKHANAKVRIDKLYNKPDENPYKGFQNSPGMDGYKTLPHLGYYKDNEVYEEKAGM